MPDFLRTQLAVDQIREFRSGPGFDPFSDAFIESLCVRSAAVMCISEVEEFVSECIKSRLGVAFDAKVSHFVAENLSSIIKRTAKSDLAKTAGMFGLDCRESFNGAVDDRDVTAYGTLLLQRHEVAHADGGDLTFGQLESGLAAARRLLEHFEASIT